MQFQLPTVRTGGYAALIDTAPPPHLTNPPPQGQAFYSRTATTCGGRRDCTHQQVAPNDSVGQVSLHDCNVGLRVGVEFDRDVGAAAGLGACLHAAPPAGSLQHSAMADSALSL